MRHLLSFFAVGVGLALSAMAWRFWASRDDAGRPIPLFFRGTDGRVVAVEAPRGGAAVLVFYSTECPISNAYGPTLNAISDAFPPSSLRMVGVCVDPDPTNEDVAAHAKEFGLKFPVVRDPEGERASRLGAMVVPEAFVLDDRGRVRYQGRIDDQFADRGLRNAAPRTSELKDAVAAVLVGRAIARPRVLAVGCPLPQKPRPSPPRAPTYARDVAPILRKHCVECHRPGQVGPFPLMTYEQARKRVFDIADVVRETRMHNGERKYRTMPPWKPARGVGPAFRNSRIMADDDVLTLLAWADANAPAGNPADLPPPAPPPGSDMPGLGTPDLVLEPAGDCNVPADGDDIDRRFVIPIDLPRDRIISAIEFRPGNPKVVRQMVCSFEAAGEAGGEDGAESTGCEANPNGDGIERVAGLLDGWCPGKGPSRLPEGVGHVLPRKAHVVLQVRYRPSGKPEVDRSRVGLYFARGIVKQAIHWVAVSNPTLTLPPGRPRVEVQATWRADADAEVHSIFPRMRRLGRDMTMTTILPDGRTQELIRIDDWDPSWQMSYDLERPLLLPKGSVVRVVAHYDNSEKNPRNPNQPPKMVRWGGSATDEVCIGLLALTRAGRWPGGMLRRPQ